jgi:hypothetical protein
LHFFLQQKQREGEELEATAHQTVILAVQIPAGECSSKSPAIARTSCRFFHLLSKGNLKAEEISISEGLRVFFKFRV